MNSTHGLSRINGKEQRLWRIWANMKARCCVPTQFAFKNYGARGIQVCAEWLNDYVSFHQWAHMTGYAEHLTIERKDNDGNYEPGNCRWVRKGDQGKNQRTTKLTKVKADRIREFHQVGVKTSELSELFGVSRSHVRSILCGLRWAQRKENA